MAGHSKWANIKRQKAVVDAKRGKIFTKISRDIIVAARHGGGDPEGNFQLRSAIEKAKAVGIPKDNIERSIAKGCGTFDGGDDGIAEIRYEGYGPGGVAVLIEAMTENRNRTAADLRAAFSKNGGNLGETGCVSWMFAQKGVVRIVGTVDEDALLEAAMEGGAETYALFDDEDEQGAEVFTEPTNLENLSQVLQQHDYSAIDAELRWIPSNTIEVTDPEQAKSVLKLMDALDDLDDVQSSTANFEISDDMMAAVF